MAKMFTPSNVIDRPWLAIRSAGRGDIRGSLQALGDPQKLSPTQLGIPTDREPTEEDSITQILATATPLVAIGLVLSHRFPLARGKQLAKMVRSESSKYSKFIMPFFNKIQDLRGIFGDTRFAKYFEQGIDDMLEVKETLRNTLGKHNYQFLRRVGRSANLSEQVATSLALQNRLAYDSQYWRQIRGVTRRIMYQEKHGGVLAKKELRQFMEARGDADLERFIQRIGVFDEAGVRQLAPSELVRGGQATTQEAMTRLLSDDIIPNISQAKVDKHLMSEGDWAKVLKARSAKTKDLLEMADKAGIKIPAFSDDPRKQATILAELRKKLEFGYQNSYFPEIRTVPEDEVNAYIVKLLEQGPKGRQNMILAGERPLASSVHWRKGLSLMDSEDLKFLGDRVSPETVQALEQLKMIPSTLKDGAPAFNTYSLRFNAVMERYIHGMGKTISWVGKGHGPRLLNEVRGPMRLQAHADPRARVRYSIAVDHYLPAAMGQLSPSETMSNLQWGALRKGVVDFFAQPSVQKKMPGVSKFVDNVSRSPAFQDLTWRNAGTKLTHWVYGATLGLNPVSAGLNMMQNLMTTSGLVPPRALAAGGKRAATNAGKFLDLISQNVPAEKAFLQAFPEWKHIGDMTEISSIFGQKFARYPGIKASVAEKIDYGQRLLMSLFTASERFNKMWAYYAGDAFGAMEKFGPELRHSLGMRIMRQSQFPGGPAGRPLATLDMWPPFSQYTMFPAKTLGLAASGPGTFGRMLTAAGLTYGAGRMAGADLSHGLMFGAMPAPYNENSPFYPMPLVPPLVQAAGAVASDVYQGEFNQTRYVLPLAVPAGVSLTRASGVLAPPIAKALGRSYADYTHPRPDGTVPVFSSNGTLKGFKTHLQLFGDAVGWRTLTGDPEQDLNQYLLKQRDQIRDIRRKYIEAIAQNNTEKANQIHTMFKSVYPELGEIPIKKSDIRAVHLRRDLTRAERVLETMPRNARDVYGRMIGVALGDSASQFLGVDPQLLRSSRTPTIRSRDPYRVVPQGAASRQLQAMQDQLSPSNPGISSPSNSAGSPELLRGDETGQTMKAFNGITGFKGY